MFVNNGNMLLFRNRCDIGMFRCEWKLLLEKRTLENTVEQTDRARISAYCRSLAANFSLEKML
jgi:hypothetical protein